MQMTIDEMALRLTTLRKQLTVAVSEQEISKKDRTTVQHGDVMDALYKKISLNAAHIHQLHTEIEELRSKMKTFPRNKTQLLTKISVLLDVERCHFKELTDSQVEMKRKLSNRSNYENDDLVANDQKNIQKNKFLIQNKSIYIKKLKLKYGQVSDLVFEQESTHQNAA